MAGGRWKVQSAKGNRTMVGSPQRKILFSQICTDLSELQSDAVRYQVDIVE